MNSCGPLNLNLNSQSRYLSHTIILKALCRVSVFPFKSESRLSVCYGDSDHKFDDNRREFMHKTDETLLVCIL